MAEETKVQVNVPQNGTVLFGKNIIKLKDLSCSTYETNNLHDFNEFLKKGSVVYADKLNLQAYDKPEVVNYEKLPVAECKLELHPVLTEFKKKNNTPIDLLNFSSFLRAMKNYATTKTLSVCDNLNDLKIQKIVSIENKSDQRGNFAIGVTASATKKDYSFPEQIEFTLPLLRNNPDTIKVSFEFLFRWELQEQNAKLEFRLVNYELDAQIDDAITALVREEVKKVPVLIGKYHIKQQTDLFKYKESDFRF